MIKTKYTTIILQNNAETPVTEKGTNLFTLLTHFVMISRNQLILIQVLGHTFKNQKTKKAQNKKSTKQYKYVE